MNTKILLLIFTIIPIIFLIGCWNSREINTLSLVICTGIDKAENGYLLTQQVLDPTSTVSRKPTNESPITLYSETGKDIFELYRKITAKSPRKLYNSHLRMVVFGEDVAKQGIRNIIDFFARDHEFRTDFYFVIAKGTTAKKVLSILSPLETIPGIKMFNSLKASEDFWAPTKSVRIIELINSIIADGKNPVLTGAEITPGDENSDSIDVLKKTNNIQRINYTEIGVLRKDKLIGWLSEDESKGYNYIIGNIKSTVGYIDYGKRSKITYEVKEAESKIKAYLLKGRPAIHVEVNVLQNVAAITGEFDVSKKESMGIINKMSEKKIKSFCDKALNKTQTEFKTDIFGFGEAIHRKYPKLWSKIKNNWNNEFENLHVDIIVKVKTNQLGQVTKPFFIKEKK